MLERFFAVTANEHARSLYQVDHDNGSDFHFPRAEKIALRGRSYYGVGEVLVAPLIVIGDVLYFCCSEELRPHDDPDPSFEGRRLVSHTSPIVALFLDKDQALECFEDPCRLALNPFWIMRTGDVIEKIGSSHPKFKMARSKGSVLLDCMFQASA
jgi:hypothetical protein